MELTRETQLTTESGKNLRVLERIAEGGQGIVYKVEYGGTVKALKWYKPSKIQNFAAFRKNLAQNIRNGSPGSCFLWPLDLTEMVGDTFGYVMEFRPNEYAGFTRFLNAKVDFASEAARVAAALNIVWSFQQLHKKGYSYQDLNDGNFFINPQNGAVLICDNDNVAPFGTNLGIAGKCRYMAPEICVGRKLPDIHTDRYSLSVILFLLFFMNHPLEGVATLPPCLTSALERKYYGERPIFIFDPNNDLNRPAKGIHTNAPALWPLYPEYFRALFTNAFSTEQMTGSAIEQRLVDREWLKKLVQLRSDLVTCSCGRDNFWSVNHRCSRCGKKLNVSFCMVLDGFAVPLYPSAKIYQCQLKGNVDVDFNTPIAEVIFAQSKGVWGLKNISPRPIEVEKSNGQTVVLENHQITQIEENAQFKYQGISAVIKKGEPQ